MPSVETIKLIIKEFSCDVNWLLDIPGTHFPEMEFNNMTIEENELLSFFRSLDSNNQKEILEILRVKF